MTKAVAELEALERSVRKLERTTEQLRRETAASALSIGKAVCDALAYDMALEFNAPGARTDASALPFIEDRRTGDQMQRWYRVRGSSAVLRLEQSLFRNELFVYRNGKLEHEESAELMRRLEGHPIGAEAMRIACDFIRAQTTT